MFPDIHTPAQLGIIYNLAEGAPNLITQIIGEDVKQNWKGLVLGLPGNNSTVISAHLFPLTSSFISWAISKSTTVTESKECNLGSLLKSSSWTHELSLSR